MKIIPDFASIPPQLPPPTTHKMILLTYWTYSSKLRPLFSLLTILCIFQLPATPRASPRPVALPQFTLCDAERVCNENCCAEHQFCYDWDRSFCEYPLQNPTATPTRPTTIQSSTSVTLQEEVKVTATTRSTLDTRFDTATGTGKPSGVSTSTTGIPTATGSTTLSTIASKPTEAEDGVPRGINNKHDTKNTGTTIIIVVVCLSLFLVLVALSTFVLRRRHSRRQRILLLLQEQEQQMANTGACSTSPPLPFPQKPWPFSEAPPMTDSGPEMGFKPIELEATTITFKPIELEATTITTSPIHSKTEENPLPLPPQYPPPNSTTITPMLQPIGNYKRESLDSPHGLGNIDRRAEHGAAANVGGFDVEGIDRSTARLQDGGR